MLFHIQERPQLQFLVRPAETLSGVRPNACSDDLELAYKRQAGFMRGLVKICGEDGGSVKVRPDRCGWIKYIFAWVPNTSEGAPSHMP